LIIPLKLIPQALVAPLASIDGLDDTFLVINADVLTNIDYNGPI
jgi:NDP-sugar pyrophosphorylase family protein